MYPILAHVGSYPIYTYGVCILLGVVAIIAISYRLARESGWTWGRFLPIVLGAVVGSIFGARLSHILVEPAKLDYLLNFYTLFQTAAPGNFVGGMIGGYLGGTLVRLSLELPSLTNEFAVGLAGASVCWRCGCTCGGCCYGTPTNLPVAVYLDGAYRHPTMLYEGVFNLIMFGLLLRLRHHSTLKRHLLPVYVSSYAFIRFWLEFIRVYPKIFLGLTGIQLFCAALLLVLGVSWLRARQSRGVFQVLP